MPPRKLIHKSRPVGGAKRGRPPKNTTPATPLEIADTSSRGSMTVADTSTPPAARPTLVTNSAQSYTGLSQVGNALTFPKFDPNSYFASDLFTDSSPLNRTTKEQADEMIQSIEEKRQIAVRSILAST